MNHKERRGSKLYVTRRFVSGDRRRQSRRTVGRLITAIFCVPLALSIAACSGNGVSEGAPTTATGHDMPDLTAAASAARASTVPLALARKMNAGSIKTGSKTDRFIIKYKDGTPERSAANTVQSRLDKFASALPARAHRKRRMGVGADVVTTERKLNAEETKAFMRAIASDPNVEYVEPDSDMQALMAPNDPDYRMQWYLRSNLGIRAEGAWDITLGQGSVIAVVDTGLTRHSDLNANILPGVDLGGGNGSGWNPGSDGSCEASFHGTHIAGIAAAVANNGVGIAGVAPGAKVESARALGPCGTGPLSDVVDGIT